MKKHFTTLLLTIFCSVAYAQENTIVNENSAWSSLWYIYGADDNDNIVIVSAGTEYYFFDGDSVFNDKTYKKVFYYKDEQHTERFFAGLIREENLKTYFIRQNTDFISTLYDFSLEQGQTFEYAMGWDDYLETVNLYVLQSDSILINNVKKKRLIITPQNDNWIIDTVIENVGSLGGLLYPLCYICVGVFHELLCYSENSELRYKNPNYEKCFYNNSSELMSVPSIEQNNFSIFPNPAKDALFITSENEKISQIDIFDVWGRKVYNEQLKNYSSKYEIAVNNLLNGLYFIKIKTEKGQILSSQFLKN
jgi:hypothetical protein